MLTKDHWLLGEYLVSGNKERFHNKRNRLAFLCGCVEPDFNVISYLKRASDGKWLIGHNYANTQAYRRRKLRQLKRIRDWRMREFFSFGRVLHYAADAFTFPHNRGFTGDSKAHSAYEKRLHKHFPLHLKRHYIRLDLSSDRNKQQLEEIKNGVSHDVHKQVERLHRQYDKMCGTIEADLEFIPKAVELLIADLRKESIDRY